MQSTGIVVASVTIVAFLMLGGFLLNSYATTVSPSLPALRVDEVTVVGVSNETATVAWLTNLPGTSQVEYGATDSYGQKARLNETLTQLHIVILDGLETGTVYHFRVLSVDAGGRTVISGDFVFATLSSSGSAAGGVGA